MVQCVFTVWYIAKWIGLRNERMHVLTASDHNTTHSFCSPNKNGSTKKRKNVPFTEINLNVTALNICLCALYYIRFFTLKSNKNKFYWHKICCTRPYMLRNL